MKKFLLVISALLCFSFAASASNQTASINESRKIVAEGVAVTHELLAGKQVDFMTTCLEITFDGTNVTYSYLIDESYYKLADIDINVIKQNALQTYETNEDFRTFATHVKNIGGNIVYTYIGSNSSTKKIFTLF